MSRDDAHQQYIKACQNTAHDYIERSTRFGQQNLQFEDCTARFVRFTIKVSHSLEVVSSHQDFQGPIRADRTDFETRDWNWYQQVVQEQATEELNRADTRSELIESVKNARYAAISGYTKLRAHPRRLFHPYTCATCHGCGEVNCTNCSGSGRVSCSRCSGSGNTTCYSCGGSGRQTHTEQVRDMTGHYRTETRYRACGGCSGGRVTCSGCGGAGRVNCSVCGGTGRVTCGTCAGHGSMTRITKTETYTTPNFFGIYPDDKPSYLHDALCKLGFPKLAQHGEVSYRKSADMPEVFAVDFFYDCVIPVCEMTVVVAGHRSQWVMLGNQPQIHDAGGILEMLLKEDLTRMSEVAGSGSRWVLPWFHRRARPVLKNVMDSEVHQNIVTLATQGKPPAAIFEGVSRAVSESYINQMIDGLGKANRAVANWSRVKLLLCTVLLAPFAILAAWSYLLRDKIYQANLSSK